jgi:precorrin-3B synthase
VTAPHRRDACPGLSAPMPTGDGLLVRFMPAECIALDAFIALCAAARAHGNGTVEITARGSLQVRGLTPRSAPLLASAIAALEIAAVDGVPVMSDPLPDDPAALIDAAGLASTVRRAIADAQLTLGAKVSVVIDGGGRLHLDALAADVRLRAIAQAPCLHVALGDDAASATPLGSIATDVAADVVVRLLGVIARGGRSKRAVDILRDAGIAAFRAAVDGDVAAAPDLPPRPPAAAIGRHPLRDGSVAVGVALAFGHAHADALTDLARIGAMHGVRLVRPAPGRALLLIGVAKDDAATLAAAAERLGFVARADDPRRRIVACPGKPACASGLIAARVLATEIAAHLPSRSGTIHISGCAKGCAHPAPAALTVVGAERGCGIVRHGSARASPRYHVDAAELVAEVVRLAGDPSEAAQEAGHEAAQEATNG